MAVRKELVNNTPDVQGGGKLGAQDKPPGDRDLVDQMIIDTEKATRLQNLRQVLGTNTGTAAPATPAKSEEKVAMNIAEMITAIGALMPKGDQNNALI